MDGKTEVTLAGPVKIDGNQHPTGAVIWVDLQTLAQLQEAGAVSAEATSVVEALDDASLVLSQGEFDAAVEAALDAALTIRLAESERDFAERKAAIEAMLVELRAETLETVQKLEASNADLEARNADLMAQIAALTPPPDAAAPPPAKKPKGG